MSIQTFQDKIIEYSYQAMTIDQANPGDLNCVRTKKNLFGRVRIMLFTVVDLEEFSGFEQIHAKLAAKISEFIAQKKAEGMKSFALNVILFLRTKKITSGDLHRNLSYSYTMEGVKAKFVINIFNTSNGDFIFDRFGKTQQEILNKRIKYAISQMDKVEEPELNRELKHLAEKLFEVNLDRFKSR
jgi:hypothetical protein